MYTVLKYIYWFSLVFNSSVCMLRQTYHLVEKMNHSLFSTRKIWLYSDMFCCHNRSLAASAPIWTFREDAECDAFDRTVTGTFRKSSTACVDNIKALWKTLNTTASQGMLTYSVIMKLYIFIIPHFL